MLNPPQCATTRTGSRTPVRVRVEEGGRYFVHYADGSCREQPATVAAKIHAQLLSKEKQ